MILVMSIIFSSSDGEIRQSEREEVVVASEKVAIEPEELAIGPEKVVADHRLSRRLYPN